MPINAQHIDMWFTFYTDIVDTVLLAAMRQLLNEAERIEESRFHFADDRKRYLVTRAMVRTVLSRYAPVAPEDWTFSSNESGRPAIATQHAQAIGLTFNLSHTRGLIALGVSRHRTLGVDVESVHRQQDTLSIAEHYFAPAEYAELARLPEAQRQARFFEYWTFKESYIKARGKGLSIPLDKFSFHFANDRAVRMVTDPVLSDAANGWRFWQLRPAPEYLLAICAQSLDGDAPILTMRKTIPMVADDIIDLPVLKRSTD